MLVHFDLKSLSISKKKRNLNWKSIERVRERKIGRGGSSNEGEKSGSGHRVPWPVPGKVYFSEGIPRVNREVGQPGVCEANEPAKLCSYLGVDRGEIQVAASQVPRTRFRFSNFRGDKFSSVRRQWWCRLIAAIRNRSTLRHDFSNWPRKRRYSISSITITRIIARL